MFKFASHSQLGVELLTRPKVVLHTHSLFRRGGMGPTTRFPWHRPKKEEEEEDDIERGYHRGRNILWTII